MQNHNVLLSHLKFFLPNSLLLDEKRERRVGRGDEQRGGGERERDSKLCGISMMLPQLNIKNHCSCKHSGLPKPHCSHLGLHTQVPTAGREASISVPCGAAAGAREHVCGTPLEINGTEPCF